MLSIDARLCYRFRWLAGVIWEISANSFPSVWFALLLLPTFWRDECSILS
jgi:hypothetical protein